MIPAMRCRAALLQLEEESLPLMLEAMWAANVLDVQSTIRKVCNIGVPCLKCNRTFCVHSGLAALPYLCLRICWCYSFV
jgi:hypothetical protein